MLITSKMNFSFKNYYFPTNDGMESYYFFKIEAIVQ
jgi:hypothetical protein